MKTFFYWVLVVVLAGTVLALGVLLYHGDVQWQPSNVVSSRDAEWVLTGDKHLFEVTERAFDLGALDGYLEGRRQWAPVGGPDTPYQPHFVSADMNTSVKPDELVVGVVNGDTATAYPVRILAVHHVINDQSLDSHAIVHLSAGAQTACAFRVPGESYFAGSGLVCRNSELLYDSETESLFLPIETMFVAGKRLGEKLDVLPSAVVTLEQWLELQPSSRIMSPNTGVLNAQYPPVNFFSQPPKLKAPGGHMPPTAHDPASPALVVFTDEGPLVASFEEARAQGKREMPLEGGYTAHFDDEFRTAYVLDGNGALAPSLRTVWLEAEVAYPEAAGAK
ncbi:MAG: DUF3179 domain-containing protein [Planctomycetes bacterium]|nr:DUF3179 domain-containing protein [Planctomycetota bacterium]